MKHFLSLLCLCVLLQACSDVSDPNGVDDGTVNGRYTEDAGGSGGNERQHEQNPDPNHTHADFAVWFDGEKVEFSDRKYMSGVSWDEGSHDETNEYHHQHLHLHDEVGHVLHRHKPGLSLEEFFTSLNYTFSSDRTWRMFVNGEEMEFDLDYVFQDMDQVLLTTSSASAQVLYEVEQLTDDACLYSRTCPWRGDPPAENCIADPAVPCVVPESEL